MARKKLTDVPGIGEKTESELRRKLKGRGSRGRELTVDDVRGMGGEGSILDVELGTKQRQNLADEGVRGVLTASDKQRINRDAASQRSTQDRSFSNVGDFQVSTADRRKAHEAHQDRPAFNQEQDEERRARITTDVDQWMNDMDSFDFPGIDTPSRSPRGESKDEPFVDEDALLRDIF